MDGNFATLYLSPKDYHRVHMPCNGRLTRMIYIPGTLFSVNPGTVRGVPGLFARNERVVCVFESEHGPFILVLVGATIVGSISTVWHGVVNPRRSGRVREWRVRFATPDIRKGRRNGPISARLNGGNVISQEQNAIQPAVGSGAICSLR